VSEGLGEVVCVCVRVFECVFECVCGCVSESVREKDKESVCGVGVFVIECERVYSRVYVCVCVCLCVCVCVCVCVFKAYLV
jgi:hypothetical protein